jgi:hypothetical protein
MQLNYRAISVDLASLERGFASKRARLVRANTLSSKPKGLGTSVDCHLSCSN